MCSWQNCEIMCSGSKPTIWPRLQPRPRPESETCSLAEYEATYTYHCDSTRAHQLTWKLSPRRHRPRPLACDNHWLRSSWTWACSAHSSSSSSSGQGGLTFRGARCHATTRAPSSRKTLLDFVRHLKSIRYTFHLGQMQKFGIRGEKVGWSLGAVPPP